MSKDIQEIIEIIEKTREISQEQFHNIEINKTLQETVIQQAKMNLVQLQEKEELIHFYRGEIEAIYNYLTK